MVNWLKHIGSSRHPITHPTWGGVYHGEYVGFRTKRRLRVSTGDRLFLYAPGGSKVFFGLAVVLTDPEGNPDYRPGDGESCPMRVRVHYEVNLPVKAGVHIDRVSTSRRPLVNSIKQKGYVRLRDDEAESAERLLREAARKWAAGG